MKLYLNSLTALGDSSGGLITTPSSTYLNSEGLGLTTGNTIYVLGGVDPDTNQTVVPSTPTFSGTTMISMEPAPPLTNLSSLHFNPHMHGLGDPHQSSQFSPGTNTPPGSHLTHTQQGLTDIHGGGQGGGSLTPDSLHLTSTPNSQDNGEFSSQDSKRKRKLMLYFCVYS